MAAKTARVVELLLTIEYDDVLALLNDPKREARITGTVLAPELSPHPLTVTAGASPSLTRTRRSRRPGACATGCTC